MGRALLLNASFEPLCVVSMRRAVVLVLKEKAEIVARNGGELHSERAVLPCPSVIRLVHFVRVPYRNRVPLSRRAVFARDGHRCQYCNRGGREHRPRRAPVPGRPAHLGERRGVVPRLQRPQGGPPPPGVPACRLRRHPRAPHASLWLIATAGSIDPAWEPYLPNGDGDRVVA